MLFTLDYNLLSHNIDTTDPMRGTYRLPAAYFLPNSTWQLNEKLALDFDDVDIHKAALNISIKSNHRDVPITGRGRRGGPLRGTSIKNHLGDVPINRRRNRGGPLRGRAFNGRRNRGGPLRRRALDPSTKTRPLLGGMRGRDINW